jgi:hypothetical protein
MLRACLALVVLPVGADGGEEPPVEIGTVRWQRDLEAALEQSRTSGRPVFLLFQEVPGCAGCKAFGRRVLSHPLLVEAAEDLFIPVLVYNNRSDGLDEALRKRFREPAWNYQVVRFLNADGEDIIPRKDRVWDLGGIASRMVDTLRAVQRPVPKYLAALAADHHAEDHAVAALAMSCFWTGEHRLGRMDGVIRTEAGWLEGREVTRVVYRKSELTLEQLAGRAARLGCADKVYAPETQAGRLKGVPTGPLTSRYRKAKPSDQKRQVARWKALHRVPDLTPMQWTKINALAPASKPRALEWLSPRQRKALAKAERTTAGN